MRKHVKITIYQGTGQSRTGFLLAGPGQEAMDFRINGAPVIEVAEGLRWKEVLVFDRGNLRTEITFSVIRTFASRDLSEQYILDHAAAIPCLGALMIECGTIGARRWLSPAGVTAIPIPRYVGVSTFHAYTIVGGRMQKLEGTITGL